MDMGIGIIGQMYMDMGSAMLIREPCMR